jgi:ankyrin repeat protein
MFKYILYKFKIYIRNISVREIMSNRKRTVSNEHVKVLISSGKIEEFQKILVNKEFRINRIFDDGHTALSFATSKGNLDIIRCAIANGAYVNPFKSDGIISKGPLHVAVNCKLKDVIMELLSAGAQCAVRDCDGLWPITIALELNDYETTEIFLNHGYPISDYIFGSKVPHYSIDFLEFILSKGMKIADMGQHCPLNLMIRYLYYYGPEFYEYDYSYMVMLNRFKNLLKKNAVAYERNPNNLLVAAFEFKLYDIVPHLIAGGAVSSEEFTDSLLIREGCFEALKSVYLGGSFITSDEFQNLYENDLDNPELKRQYRSFMLWFETQEAKTPLKLEHLAKHEICQFNTVNYNHACKYLPNILVKQL